MGIDEVRILNRIAGKPLPAHATEFTLAELTRRFDYAFRPWRPPGFYCPVLEPRPFRFGDVVEAAGLALQVFEQDHRVMKTVGFRIGAFGYSTDLVTLDDAGFDILRGVDTWLVGCFQRQPHSTHASLARVLEWSERVGARRTVLTHMGPDMDWAWLRARLPAGVEPGYDGLTMTFDG